MALKIRGMALNIKKSTSLTIARDSKRKCMVLVPWEIKIEGGKNSPDGGDQHTKVPQPRIHVEGKGLSKTHRDTGEDVPRSLDSTAENLSAAGPSKNVFNPLADT